MEMVENIQMTAIVLLCTALVVSAVEVLWENYKGVKVNGWWAIPGGLIVLIAPAVIFVTTIIRIWS